MNKLVINLTSFRNKIKQAFETQKNNHHAYLIFQVRISVLIILALFNISGLILKPDYSAKLTFSTLFFQLLNFYLLCTQRNSYLIAFSFQLTVLTPGIYLSSNIENVFRIPILTLAYLTIYCLQFYPLSSNVLFFVWCGFLADTSKIKLQELFAFDPNILHLLKTGNSVWFIVALAIVSSISAYQICNERVWKGYSLVKKELQEKNQELLEANRKMEEMLVKLEQTNQQLATTNKNLADALKAQDLFVACVSHELRNPLNAMIGNIEILQLESLTKVQKKMLKTCQICGEMLLVLINNLLDVAKINAEKLEINFTPVNMHSFFEKIWEVSRIRILQKGLSGKLIISKNLPLWLKVDSHRLMQIILNLMGNATKFTTTGGVKLFISWEESHSTNELQERDILPVGTLEELEALDFTNCGILQIPSDESIPYKIKDFLTVSTRFTSMSDLNSHYSIVFDENNSDLNSLKTRLALKPNRSGALKIEVIDTGCGIVEEAQSKLFQPFVQADSSITRQYGGTGLGLYIIKQLIQKMNGTINLSSEMDVGSKFTIKIPLSSISDEETKQINEAALSNQGLLSQSTQDHHVLIVDDNPYNQSVLKTYFGTLSISSEVASNGQEAVTKFKSQPPGYYSLVTLDIQMPVMDGITAAKLIRQYEKEIKTTISVPIVVVTGNCSQNEQKECLDPLGEVRASYFFRKPFLYSDCKFSVDSILKQNQRIIENRKILIVDDESFNRELMQLQIEKLGLKCEMCRGGADAVKKLKEDSESFALVMMDFEMPGMNGIEATKQIRNNLKLESLYIVGTTGTVEESVIEMSLQNGMNKVLTKPVTLSQISSLLKDLRLISY